MPKTLVACCTLTSIQLGPYMDHNSLSYHLGKDLPKSFKFYQCNTKRMSIDRFRNFAMKVALSNKFDYLFFIDDDMQLPHDSFKKLYEAKYDIVAALSYIRGYPFDPMAFRFADKEKKHLAPLKDEDIPDPKENKVIDVDAIGTSVCLIRLKKLREIPPPWFLTGPNNTEDIYYCMKAKDFVKKVKIGVHTGVVTGHTLDPEVISYYTKEHLVKYYESYMTPGQVEATKSKDRGEAYVEANIESEDENT